MEGICTAVPDVATTSEGRLLPLLEDLVSMRRIGGGGGVPVSEEVPPVGSPLLVQAVEVRPGHSPFHLLC